ncbi:MAG: hypothetical protein AAF907_04970 [Planctomycetota bacterium]
MKESEITPNAGRFWSVGALETLLIQDVGMTAFAAVVSHQLRNGAPAPGAPLPLDRWILLELALWGGGLGMLFALLSLAAVKVAGTPVVWTFGRPPLAAALALTVFCLLIAGLFAPFVVPRIWGVPLF